MSTPSGLVPAPRAAGDKVPARIAYSPGEAAQLLGCTRAHVYSLLNAGTLPSVHLGRLRRIPARALVALIEGGTDAA